MEDDANELVLPCASVPSDRLLVEWIGRGFVALRSSEEDIILTSDDILRLVAFLNNPKG